MHILCPTCFACSVSEQLRCIFHFFLRALSSLLHLRIEAYATMASRGRPRKRLGQIDAAIDAMAPFGFDESLVRKTVNKLLKEYGGNEGWAFIEDCGYKELIEAVLRDLESNDEGTTNLQEDERAVDTALESTIGTSSTHLDSTCNKAGNTVGETASTVLVNAVRKSTYEELCSNKQDIGSSEVLSVLPAEGDGNGWKDIGEDKTSTQLVDGGNSGSEVQAGSNYHVTTPPPTSSACSLLTNLPPLATLPSSKRVCLEPPRRRVPCYGWIESDDEEDAEDFIQLPPMRPTINA